MPLACKSGLRALWGSSEEREIKIGSWLSGEIGVLGSKGIS